MGQQPEGQHTSIFTKTHTLREAGSDSIALYTARAGRVTVVMCRNELLPGKQISLQVGDKTSTHPFQRGMGFILEAGATIGIQKGPEYPKRIRLFVMEVQYRNNENVDNKNDDDKKDDKKVGGKADGNTDGLAS